MEQLPNDCFKHIIRFSDIHCNDVKIENIDEDMSVDVLFAYIDACACGRNMKNLLCVNKAINEKFRVCSPLLKIKNLLSPYENLFESLYRNNELVLFKND